MEAWLPELRSGYDRATIRTIQVAFALSLLLHIAVLWPWQSRPHFLSLDNPERGNASGPLIVELAPRPSPAVTPPPAPPPATPTPPSRPVEARPAPAKRPPTPKAVPRPPSAPPVLARKKPTPAVVPRRAEPPAAAPAPSPPPIEGDLSSYIEARRRARGEAAPAFPRSEPPPAPSEEDERERHNRIVAANLGLLDTPTFGHDPEAGGGIFQIQRMGLNDAAFIFFGWNKDIGRNSRQLIEVERGDNSDIRIAVVRKMIAIIREKETGDFVWRSKRLGQSITLSARPRDNAGLEGFLMRDLFADAGWPN
jgi:hypothetical protein